MSWQAHLIHLVLRVGGRRAARTGEQLRADLRKAPVRPSTPSRKIARDLEVTVEEIDGVEVYLLRHSGGRPTQAVFYCHGGAYCFEIAPAHWKFLCLLAKESGTAVYVPLYRLAPASTATQTVPAMAAILDKVAATHGDENVTVMGDSAGGGLALAITQQRPQHRLRQLVLISPWLDVATNDPEQSALGARDLMLHVAVLQEAGRLYAGQAPLDDPLASPLHGPMDRLPPTHVFIGTHDLLLPDSQRLAARAAGRVQVREWAGMQHVWPLFPFLPEARAARRQIIALCATEARQS